MNRMALDFIARILGVWVLLCLGGCVAPVPLVESDTRQMWAGRVDGREVIIEQVEKNWYMPIVVSPEGPAKMRTSGFRYIYHWVHRDSNKATVLPFLELKTDSSLGYWQEFFAIEGSALVLAVRIVDHAWSPGRPEMLVKVGYEIAVFDAKRLKHRRLLEATVEEGQGHRGAWHHIQKKHGGRYLEYLSASGPRRYSTLDDIDEPAPVAK